MKQLLWMTMLFALAAGCASRHAVEIPQDVPELRAGILQGYLAPEALPDSAAILPPPPADGTAAMARDQEAAAAALALRGTPRWELATVDAELRFPEAAGTFACALGVAISENDAPNAYMLLRRSLADLGLSTYGAKNRYVRPRPFMLNGEAICTPEQEDLLRGDGAYPSGHSAIGWGWALILAELAPTRENELLARGRAFSESRMVCNVHWLSDVTEGRTMGAAAVARLHADPVFRAQLDLARGEMTSLLASGGAPDRDCAAEAAALASSEEAAGD